MTITKQQIADIRNALETMLANINLFHMATAMNTLYPNRKTFITPDLLNMEIRSHADLIMKKWGKVNEDASLVIPEFEMGSVGSGTRGFMLTLYLDESENEWHWDLTLQVADKYIYSEVEYE